MGFKLAPTTLPALIDNFISHPKQSYRLEPSSGLLSMTRCNKRNSFHVKFFSIETFTDFVLMAPELVLSKSPQCTVARLPFSTQVPPACQSVVVPND
jgi:hypothetical protein